MFKISQNYRKTAAERYNFKLFCIFLPFIHKNAKILCAYILPSYTASFVNSIPSFLNVFISTADSMADV